jgi:hypothetical protein
VREVGRIPAERTTTYQTLRVLETETERPDLLDGPGMDGDQFGSYHSLIASGEFRYRKAR